MAKEKFIKKQITENDRKVLKGLQWALNHAPIKQRIVFAWRIIRGRF
jgi:hypothetical protein